MPNLAKLKKLGKRAGPGGKTLAKAAAAEEAPKKKEKGVPARKGKQARVWSDAGGAAGGKGECPALGLPVWLPVQRLRAAAGADVCSGRICRRC